MSKIVRKWMRPAHPAIQPPFFAVFRNCFHCGPGGGTLEFQYSADERVMFFLDGEKVGSGPERGTIQKWYMGRLILPVSEGNHVLTARLLAFGKEITAFGQMSIQPGLWVQEDSSLLGKWEVQVLLGCSFTHPKTDWAAYAHLLADEDFNHHAIEGKGGVWETPAEFGDDRELLPPELPPMRDEAVTPAFRKGNGFFFNDYVCVYGDYRFSGTGEVRIRWAEVGANSPDSVTEEFWTQCKPGDPNPVFSESGDRIRLTGEPVRWIDYWWHAGRTVEITCFGGAKLEKAEFRRTGYPWVLRKKPEVPGEIRLNNLLRKSWHTLECCTFETFMDCPYYEQLQYVSDSRLDMLAFYELTDDRRLIKKALRQFNEGVTPEGWAFCRYPSRDCENYTPKIGEFYRIHIPSFTAFYPQMVRDFTLRCPEEREFIRSLLPACRRAADYLLTCRAGNGLPRVSGWNFIDWRPNWEYGIPPNCREGDGCSLAFITLMMLQDMAEMEGAFGTPEAQMRYAAEAEELAAAIRKNCYLPDRKCYAEHPGDSYVSEHAQVLALLALGDTSVIPALRSGKLDQCSISFSFYALEAFRMFGLEKEFDGRRELYLATADDPELYTMPENFPNGWWYRSNCHAWSSHILYHTFAQKPLRERRRKM